MGDSEGISRKMVPGEAVGGQQLSRGPQGPVGRLFWDVEAKQSSGLGKSLEDGRLSDLELGGETASPAVPQSIRTETPSG